MSARPISTSTISFGLVSLPVKLYSTGESSSRIRFNWINRDTGARVKYQYVDSKSGEPVERRKMVKGYQFAKDRFVTFDADELKAIEAQATGEIEITEFVPENDIERVYLEKAYYLGPAQGGGRAYRLLSAALRATGRVAIARHAARGRQRLVMIRPMEDGLILEQLLYADEVRSFDQIPREEGQVSEAELALARQLIDQAASESFDPERYRDEVREKILELINGKVKGEEITLAPSEEAGPRIVDLMEALKASLDPEGGAGKGEEAEAPRLRVVAGGSG